MVAEFDVDARMPEYNITIDENDLNCGLRISFIPNLATNIIYFNFSILRTGNTKLQVIDNKKVVSFIVDFLAEQVGYYRTQWDLTNKIGEAVVAPGLYQVQFIFDDEIVCEGDIQVLIED